ncbi:hypothetical protein [Enterococcus gallinarum]|uniref:hypothetical protein n=1 Tax=Enterococcus gallinarum TaxID=1353 RepID=UPI002892B0F6|nr:hypothetical protein [Enterococcus gallinarum]
MTNKIPKTKQAITNLVDLDTSLFETLMINKVIPTANVKKYQNPIVIVKSIILCKILYNVLPVSH